MLKVIGLDAKVLCELDDKKGSGCTNVSLSKKKSESSSLSFKFPAKNKKSAYVVTGNYIIYKNEVYEIIEKKKTYSENDDVFYEVSCLHMSDLLRHKYIVDMSLDPAVVLTQMTAVLVNTGWTIGTIQANTTLRGFEFGRQTVFEALITIAEAFNCHLEFSVKLVNGNFTYTVNMLDRSTDSLFDTYFINRNMINVDIVDSIPDFVTRLYCFGGTNPVTGLDVDIIDAMVFGSPWGKTYVENFSYYLSQGISQEYINAHPQQFIKEDIWEDSNYVDPDDLYLDGVKRLEKLSQPTIELTIKKLCIEDKIPLLGYPVQIIDEDYSNTYSCYIEAITTSEEDPYIYDISVSSAKITKNIFKELGKAINKVKSTVTNGNIIKDSSIRDASISTIKVGDEAITSAKILSLIANKIIAGKMQSTDGKTYFQLDGVSEIMMDGGTNGKVKISPAVGLQLLNSSDTQIGGTALINNILMSITGALTNDATDPECWATIGELTVGGVLCRGIFLYRKSVSETVPAARLLVNTAGSILLLDKDGNQRFSAEINGITRLFDSNGVARFYSDPSSTRLFDSNGVARFYSDPSSTRLFDSNGKAVFESSFSQTIIRRSGSLDNAILLSDSAAYLILNGVQHPISYT